MPPFDSEQGTPTELPGNSSVLYLTEPALQACLCKAGLYLLPAASFVLPTAELKTPKTGLFNCFAPIIILPCCLSIIYLLSMFRCRSFYLVLLCFLKFMWVPLVRTSTLGRE